jgi:hypothetical protein
MALFPSGPGDSSDVWDAPDDAPGLAVVGSGIYSERLPISGMSVEAVRQRFADRLDIDPSATAVLDGNAVDDEQTTVHTGQTLIFVRWAGEKGTHPCAGRGTSAMSQELVTIRGQRVEARRPEGATASQELSEFLQKLAPSVMSTCGAVLPDGVRMICSTRKMSILIWELAPQVHRVRWIRKNSPAPFKMPGREVAYEFRQLALPYLVIAAVFVRGPKGRLVLTGRNEAYFRTETLKSGDDPLLFPALLNISKFPASAAAERPLAWICTQHTNLRALAKEPDFNRRVRRSLLALKSTILEAGFNYSSEHHELTSYWSLSAKRIPEVADLDRWEECSRRDPLFVLNVPWLPAASGRKKLNVHGLVDRIVAQAGAEDTPIASVEDLSRLVFNDAPGGGSQ